MMSVVPKKLLEPMQRWLRLLYFSLSPLLFFSPASSMEAISDSRYEVKARLISNSSSPKIRSFTNDIIVIVDECKVQITARPLNAQKLKQVIFVSDGVSNSFVQTDFAEDQGLKGKNRSSLDLFPTTVPNSGNLISYAWQAYASACYYKSRTNNQVEPASFVAFEFQAKGMTLTSEWLLSSNRPHLPQIVVERFEKTIYFPQKGGGLGSEPISQVSGFSTNAVFQTLSWTNFENRVFPLTFAVKRYGWIANEKKSALQQEVRGETVSISADFQEPEFVANPPPKTMIYDHKIGLGTAYIPTFDYFSSDGNLMTESEIRSTIKFRNLAGDAMETTKAPLSRWLIALGFLLTLLFTLLIIFLVKIKQKETHE